VVAANAVLNARVQLGDCVYVGANATILPEIKIGAGATIGAGSAVIEDVPPGATVVGVPAQSLIAPGRDQEPRRQEASAKDAGRMERIILPLWKEVLGLSQVGLQDNFFDLGGTSLLALRLHERIRAETRSDLALTDIFQFPTVGSLAVRLSGSDHRAIPAAWTRAQMRRSLMRGNERP
jgi:hypothetical protein